jgi:hypothetical protein
MLSEQILLKQLKTMRVAPFLLDYLEEFIDLSLEEWNFRHILQDNIAKLLGIHYKQRGNIKWATLGDKNTKKIHATETIKHNKSTIMVLKNVDGIEMTRHEEKAAILWEAFEDRLGSSDFSQMHFNLQDLIQEVGHLDDLVQPILKEEIENIVKNLRVKNP